MPMHVYTNRILNFNKVLHYKYVYQDLFLKNICRYSLATNIDKTLLNNYVKHLQKEYDTINNPNISSKNHRLKELNPIIQILNERQKIAECLTSIKELVKETDEEMKKLAEEEAIIYENKMLEIEEELIKSLIPKNNDDLCDSIVLEINAGVGGQEAMLFAKEIYHMYINFVAYKGWSYELAEFDTSDLGGLRHASIFVTGDEVYQFFKYEAGVHRVQRIPTTEKSGRVHTSTISVTALPQPTDVDITIQDKDLRIDTMRASGAGGQHVNTTDSAVRIVHLPTNTMVECQVSRSQIKNKEMAIQKLRALLYEKQINDQIATTVATRKSQVRSNFRNEKIRTYNFSQDRLTDHRLQGSNIHNLKVFLEGGEPLEVLINKLHSSAKVKEIMDILLTANKA